MSRPWIVPGPWLLGLAALALACTDASLYGIEETLSEPNKLVLSGDLCTEDPTERGFPVKVLFLVDTTMEDAPTCTSAPAPGCYASQRGDSTLKVVRTFGGSNYSYGVIRYASALKGTACGIDNLTPDGFTRFVDDAIVGIRCAETPFAGRDIMSALSLASSFVSGDVLATPKGLRARTKYVIVLLAYGPPTQSLPSLWCNSQNPRIEDPDECNTAFTDQFCGDMQPPPADCERALYIKTVRDMKAFAIDNGAQELWFHSVYQRDVGANAANLDDPAAISLLTDLAIAGEGSLYQYPPGPRPTPAGAEATGACAANDPNAAGCLFAPINFDSTQSVYLRKEFIVSNRNAIPTVSGIIPDSDGDGLSDELEEEIGTDPMLLDTDGDYLSDRLEHVMHSVGLNPLITNLPPCTEKGVAPNLVGGCCPPGGCPVPPDPAIVCYCAPDCTAGVSAADCVDPAATPEMLLPWPPECPLPQSYLPNAFPPDQDLDGDGLTDCEELLQRSEPTLLDSDADGVPDILEFRYGSNPLFSDALGDIDADGTFNADEIRWHTDPLSKDIRQQETMSYRYHFTDAGEKDLVSYSQPINATGVVILNASHATSPGQAKLLLTLPGECGGGPATPTLNWIDPDDVMLAASGTGAIDACDPALATGTTSSEDPTIEVVPLAVPIPEDGEYTLHSISSVPGLPEGDLSITVRVISVLFPAMSVQDNIRLSSSRRFCFNFRASNITLLQTLPDEQGNSWNYIDVFLAEVPKNNSASFGVYRVATIPIIYSLDPPMRQPPDAEIVLSFDDFLPLGE